MAKLDVVYCRVSTDEQSDNTSLGDQEARCKESLQRIGLNNIVVYHEDFSGFSYERPELDKIKELIRRGEVRSFSAWRVDRLCRKASILELLRDEYFKPYNVRVFTFGDLGAWQWNPMHESMQEQAAVYASNWGKMAKMAMLDGKIASVKKGNTLTFGQPPFGYDEKKEGKRTYIIKNEDEARIVLLIFRLFVEEDMSLRAIALKLNDERIATFSEFRGPTRFLKNKEQKSTPKWRTSVIRQILTNTTYDGTWTFGRTKSVKMFDEKSKEWKTKRIKNSEDLIQVPVERIVPHELFTEAQKKLETNKTQKAGNPAKYPYLMRRHMTCTCGLKMGSEYRNTGHGQNLYYTCLSKVMYYEKGRCKPAYINTKLIDEKAWTWLHSILTNRELLKSKIDNILEEKEKAAAPLKEKLANIDKILIKKHKEHDSMVSSYFKLPELAQTKALASMAELEERIKEDKQEVRELQAQLDSLEESTKWIKWYLQECDKRRKEDGEEGAKAYARAIAGVQKELLMQYEAFKDSVGEPVFWHWRDVDYSALAKLQEDKPLTFEEKRRYIEQFNVQGKLIREDDKLYLHLTCALNEEIMMELYGTIYAKEQYHHKGFKIVFSDKFLLDFSSLPQFQQVAA